MDFVNLVRAASKGDVNAFVALTRRFQHLAFGSALALVHDFQLSEDIVQDAFVAAWSALPRLSDPAAFPGWLRSIVRHYAFRTLRRKQLNFVPLTEAAEVASEEPAPDRVLASRDQYAIALRALADLSPKLHEPATLFYVHDCSHQETTPQSLSPRMPGAVPQVPQAHRPSVVRSAGHHGQEAAEQAGTQNPIHQWKPAAPPPPARQNPGPPDRPVRHAAKQERLNADAGRCTPSTRMGLRPACHAAPHIQGRS